MFLLNLRTEFLKHLEIDNHIIELINNEQLVYNSIYILKLM